MTDYRQGMQLSDSEIDSLYALEARRRMEEGKGVPEGPKLPKRGLLAGKAFYLVLGICILIWWFDIALAWKIWPR